ncbi:MAG: CoA pyrophosphatase [Spirochaetota bacterium]|nr:CoA pyrophosphatase [Spirochaetota bacterium]
MHDLLKDSTALFEHILRINYTSNRFEEIFTNKPSDLKNSTAVLLLLGLRKEMERPCLILNKRSRSVRQAGDLCCPGGSLSHRLDSYIASILPWPGFPLARWPYWSRCHSSYPQEAKQMSLLFATCLRECFEEMRLNPFGVRFLGPLPSQDLYMARRVMYPMIGWISCQKRFFPNWEVERVIYVPLEDLLNPDYYARMRLDIDPKLVSEMTMLSEDYPCFVHIDQNETEILWGATYRVVTIFLELAFNFQPPDLLSLPLVHKKLDKGYFAGLL